jgi:energy-converting hydrogenase Eha subunit H
VLAQSLYLLNLLVLPIIGFLALGWLALRTGPAAPPLALSHCRQALVASLWGGALLVLASIAILGIGGLGQVQAWTLAIVYFTCVHATLVMVGIVGLAKAMAGRCWRVPLIGPPLPPGCPR